jgi:hypothetical protein
MAINLKRQRTSMTQMMPRSTSTQNITTDKYPPSGPVRMAEIGRLGHLEMALPDDDRPRAADISPFSIYSVSIMLPLTVYLIPSSS